MTAAGKIIDVLGGTSAVARALGAPPSTVSSWRKNGIPHWRWAALHDLAERMGLSFDQREEVSVEPVIVCDVCERIVKTETAVECRFADCPRPRGAS